MRTAVAVALCIAGCAGEPCDGLAGTCVSVHVASSPTVSVVDRLDFLITFGPNHGSASVAVPSGQLPVGTAVELGELGMPSATVRVIVHGEQAGSLVGAGEGSVTLADGAHTALHLSLGPEEPPDLATGDAAPGDAATDGDAGPVQTQTCMPGGLYCGGDQLAGASNSLYRCVAGAPPELRGACANGCVVRPGLDDACYGGGAACVVNGLYCGGDKVTGDPRTLYRCTSSGVPAPVMLCPNACVVVAGADDKCQ